jgi:GTP-binding protein
VGDHAAGAEGRARGEDLSDDAPTSEQLEAARKLFAGACDFVAGAAVVEALPGATLPEIAFVGRSNVGKSSLVNALTGRKTLARVSRSPGRTQQINFFDLAHRLMLVDLPGYGFARVAKAKKHGWSVLAESYLKGRPSLRRALVLIDARHGIKDLDRATFAALDSAAVSWQAVLTKADLCARDEIAARIAETVSELAKTRAGHPEIIATSAERGDGIPALRAALAALATVG